MEITELTIRIIIILVPGVIASLVLNTLKVRHKKQSDYLFTIISIVLGLGSYMFLQLLCYLFGVIKSLFPGTSSQYYSLKTLKSLSNGTVVYTEILFASVCAVILAFIVAYLDNKKLINSIGRKLNVSNKYGDENAYTYFLNSQDIDWVYIRDMENKLTYLGLVEIFSETEEIKELVLSDVTVFSYPDSEELYRINKIYLSYSKDKMIIERPNFKTNGEE